MDGEVFQSEKGGKKKEGTRLRDGREKSRGREGEKTAAMAVQNCGLFMDFGGQKPFADLPPFVILAGLDTKGTVWSKEAFFFFFKKKVYIENVDKLCRQIVSRPLWPAGPPG